MCCGCSLRYGLYAINAHIFCIQFKNFSFVQQDLHLKLQMDPSLNWKPCLCLVSINVLSSKATHCVNSYHYRQTLLGFFFSTSCFYSSFTLFCIFARSFPFVSQKHLLSEYCKISSSNLLNGIWVLPGLAVINKASVSISLQIVLWTYIFSRFS